MGRIPEFVSTSWDSEVDQELMVKKLCNIGDGTCQGE